MCHYFLMSEESSTTASARRQHIIQAAISVFLRYGYARTTLADIAKAAGMARTALYLMFSDKEAIFSAVVEAMVTEKLSDIRRGLPERSSFEAKLRFACESWGAEGFDLVQAHPDAKDMFDLGFASVCGSYSAFEELLVEIIKEPLREAGFHIQAKELAHVIAFAIKGLKDVARDGKEIRRMIGVQVALVAGALGASSKQRKHSR
jgi:AcrR family transcriptional regulator